MTLLEFVQLHNYILFLIIGSGIGFLSGLLGKGGSAITTPALQVFCGVPSFSALSSPLPVSLPSAFSASVAYRKEKLLNYRLIQWVLVLGVPATLTGAFFSDLFEGRVLMLLTAAFILLLGASFFVHSSKLQPEETKAKDIPFYKIVLVSILVGFTSGLLANSGGALFGPLFIRYLKMPVKKALASSLVVAAGLAVPGTLVHWYLGHIDWYIVLLLSLSSIPFSHLGAKSAITIKSDYLEKIFGLTLILFGIFDILYNV